MLLQKSFGGRASHVCSMHLKVLMSLAVMAFIFLPSTSQAMDSGHIRFIAEGVVPLNFILSPAPVDFSQLPPWLAGGLMNGSIEVRQRMTFRGQGPGKDVLSIQVYCIDASAPLPLPEAPPVIAIPQSNPGDIVTISLFLTQIEDLEVSNYPSPNFSLIGKGVKMIVPSPFGNLVGASAVYTAGVTAYRDGTATFTMLGGSVAGSHATYSPQAEGAFYFRGPQMKDEDQMLQQELRPLE